MINGRVEGGIKVFSLFLWVVDGVGSTLVYLACDVLQLELTI